MSLLNSPFEVPFASLLAYSPRGVSETSKKSLQYRDAIKSAVPGFCDKAAQEISKYASIEKPFFSFFGENVTLVPAPKSSVFNEGALWPGRQLCLSLIQAALGASVIRCVRRDIAVPKSAFAAPGDRPDFVKHVESCSFVEDLSLTNEITIVDDIITRGASLAAFAAITKQHRPQANVRVFALIRTMGLQPEIENILEPCVGNIKVIDGKVSREP